MAERSTVECARCRAAVPLGSRFCARCGYLLPEGRTCLACGNVVTETAGFCSSCGTAVSAAALGPPPLPLMRASETLRGMVPAAPIGPPPLPPAPATYGTTGAGTPPPPPPPAMMPRSIGTAASAFLPYGWRTIVGGTMPAFPPLVSSVSHATSMDPTAAGLARSARGSAVFLALASVGEIATTIATANSAAMATVWARAVLTLIATVAGLIAGRTRGVSSLIAVVTSLGLFLVQGSALMTQCQQAFMSRDAFVSALPNLLTQGTSLLAALRAAWAAARK